MKQWTKVILILSAAMLLIGLPVCFAQQPGPEDVYRQYRKLLSSTNGAHSLDGFYSARTVAMQQKIMKELRAQGQTEAEIQTWLFEGVKKGFQYEASRKQIDFKQSDGKAVMTFEVEDKNVPDYFKDNPEIDSVVINETIEEVHFVYEDGWKIDNTVIRPKKAK